MIKLYFYCIWQKYKSYFNFNLFVSFLPINNLFSSPYVFQEVLEVR